MILNVVSFVLTRRRRLVRVKIGRASLEKDDHFALRKFCTIGQPTTYLCNVAKRKKNLVKVSKFNK